MKKVKVEIRFINDEYGMLIAKWGYWHFCMFYEGNDIYVDDVKDPGFWATYTYVNGNDIYKRVCRYIASLDSIESNVNIEERI